jgi:hypothetical protein
MSLALVEWTHPRHGRVRDAVCPRHEAELLRALKTLGIGCGGRSIDIERCGRCEAEREGVEARFYLGLAGAGRGETAALTPTVGGDRQEEEQ